MDTIRRNGSRSGMYAKKKEIFRLKLPTECILFYSEEGKAIFSEALASGHMNCYFKLAAQFRTQDEPDYRGLSTLVMILNALDVDPGVVWKGPWRWYHENMLKCSSPIPKEKRKTITMQQFAAVAECNFLNASILNTDSNSEEIFRQIIKDHSQRDDSFVVASYSRESYDGNEDVDFFPIGGYHPIKDCVLLLDTARFKYPPYWIKIPTLIQAMNATNTFTDFGHGYVTLKKKLNSRKFLFQTSNDTLPIFPSKISSNALSFLQQWMSYLRNETNLTSQKEFTIEKSIDKFLSLVSMLNPDSTLLDILNEDNNCLDKISEEFHEELKQQLENTHLFQRILHKINLDNSENPCQSAENENNIKISQLFLLKRIDYKPFRIEHILTVLLLSWPFCCILQGRNDEVCVGKILHDYIRHQFQVLFDPLATQVIGLTHQLSVRLHLINLET